MSSHCARCCTLVFLGILAACGTAPATERGTPRVLFDFGADFAPETIQASDADAVVTDAGTLRIQAHAGAERSGVALKPQQGKWDLSLYRIVSLDITNRHSVPIVAYCRVADSSGDGASVTRQVTIESEASAELTVPIFPVPWRLSRPLELIGMRGTPLAAGLIDTANVTQLSVFCNPADSNCVFEIDNVRSVGAVDALDASSFVPFVDEFGQYSHGQWPGKTNSIEELIAVGRAESQDIEAHPGPNDWNAFGGWAAGPQLTATGFFRVQKYQDKWWLVDPNGRLFWSHGINCVTNANPTPITDRETYFRELPEDNSPFAQFYGTGSWAPHGYYIDKLPYRTYDFSRANCLRKYGEGFGQAFIETTQRRLRSWAVNTIANWSSEQVYVTRKTPYVGTISFDAERLAASEGYWGKFYDVFHPGFREALRQRLEAEREKTAGDPWCIGYFVDNELSWGDDTSLAVATLASPATQEAKKAFISDLRARYETIETLNETWGTAHATWEALLESTTPPDIETARMDLGAFYTKTAETYFRTVREELQRVAPNQLYLGCRFAEANERAARAAAMYCDVVSYNRYTYSVRDFSPPEGADIPALVGEFHFGAFDRGLFHTGLKAAQDQQDRANKYAAYVRGALENPYLVGTHWFQYKDQPVTGRGDGENYQIGFVDVCDRPYPEIVDAARSVGYDMYDYRLGN